MTNKPTKFWNNFFYADEKAIKKGNDILDNMKNSHSFISKLLRAKKYDVVEHEGKKFRILK